MARKVFISVLGTGFYGKCKYTRGEYNSVKASETRFIQQSTLEYLNVYDWSKNDAAIFLLTSKAKSQNWNREIKSRVNFSTKEEEEYLGLEYVLEQMNLPVEIRPVDIVDQNHNYCCMVNYCLSYQRTSSKIKRILILCFEYKIF